MGERTFYIPKILNKKTTETATRQAVLDKLGLTADEVAALLG